MNAKGVVAGLAMAGVVAGCTGGDRLVYEEDGIPPVVEQLSMDHETRMDPATGGQHTGTVGDALFEQVRFTVFDEPRAELVDRAIGTLPEGHVISIPAGRSAWLRREGNARTACFDYATEPEYGDPAHVCLIDDDNEGRFTRAMFKGGDETFDLDPVGYELTGRTERMKDGDMITRRVVLTGFGDDGVTVRFPRLVGTLASGGEGPATYPLAADGTGAIERDGLRIRILGVEGDRVRYVVDSGFTKL